MVGAADNFRRSEPYALEHTLSSADPAAPLGPDALVDTPLGVSEASGLLATILGRFGVPGMGEVNLTSPQAILGRDPACSVVLNNISVSPAHAQIVLRDGIWWLTDLASVEGSWVDGEPVTGPTPLAPGSLIRLGQAVMVFDPRDLWLAPPSPEQEVPAGPMVVSWQPRDEPMAPSFEWPAHTRRNRWPLFGVLVLVVAAIIALILRAA